MRFFRLSDSARPAMATRGCREALLIILTGAAALSAGAQEISDRFYQAIRTNDMASLRRLTTAASVNARDNHGTSLLLNAALYLRRARFPVQKWVHHII